MQKKSGFSLIELLAVIVILSIVIVITTPIIMGVIDDVKKKAVKDSMYGYIEAVDLASTKSVITDATNDLLSGIYTTKNGNLYCDDTTEALNVDFKGTKPDNDGIVILTNGRITKAKLTFNGYMVTVEGTFVDTDNNTNEIVVK